MEHYQICKRCVMDTTDPDIKFDDEGICNHCKKAEYLLGLKESPTQREKSLQRMVKKIKKDGSGKKYDCIIGVSGGVDSSFVVYKLKELGIRPLAVHFDNGWNSESGVRNISKIVEKLDIDLYTYVMDWEEFRDLQLSFLRASTPDSEIPTDHAIFALLYETALKQNVKYIITGSNLVTEAIHVKAWSCGHDDWKYIQTIQKLFGKKKLDSFPHFTIFEKYLIYPHIKGIKIISLLEYIDYNKQEAKKILMDNFEWEDYGGKHYESIYTRFLQGYILPNKFGFDKRKGHLSNLIISGQITRDEALNELGKDPYEGINLQEDLNYLLNKFNITEEEFDSIMGFTPKTFWDYPSYKRSWYYKLARLPLLLKTEHRF